MSIPKGKVTRLCNSVSNESAPEIISVVKLSKGGNSADATFCITNSCNDCGRDCACECDRECSRNCSCVDHCGHHGCRCEDHYPSYEPCGGESAGYK